MTRDATCPSVRRSRVGALVMPGKKGTKKLVREYGDALVCVRYRYDEIRGKRLKTVEIVVHEAPWKPRRRDLVLVELKSWESALRERVKKAGGFWRPDDRVWRLRHDRALKLGLAARIRGASTPKKLLSAETSKLLRAETLPTFWPKSFGK